MRTYSGAELDQIVERHHEAASGRVLIFSAGAFIAGLIIGMLIRAT